MPKITGPTVVEHRAAQHRALLASAERLINESGGNVPTLTEVAEAMGLARSSINSLPSGPCLHKARRPVRHSR